jgi:hypothetical protein
VISTGELEKEEPEIGKKRKEKKNKEQSGKRRGEEADRVDRRKWMGSADGNKRGDEEEELTYVGSRGETVIDYAIVNEAAWERVKELKVGERVDSDHLPLKIIIEGKNQEEKEKGGTREEEKKVTVKVWDEQGVKEYRRRLEEATFKEQEIVKCFHFLDFSSMKLSSSFGVLLVAAFPRIKFLRKNTKQK